jgi:DNA-binding CsgD family transcriptional regulator
MADGIPGKTHQHHRASGHIMSQQHLSDLIARIYAGALDPKAWETLAPLLAANFNAHSCALQLTNVGAAQSHILGQTGNFTADFIRSYEENFFQFDEWVKRGIKVGPNRAVIGDEMIDDRSFTRTLMYNEWCTGIDVRHLVGAIIEVSPSHFGAIGIHRASGQENFDRASKEKLQLLLPHLSQAMRLYRLTSIAQAEARVAEDALDALGIGVIIAGADARVIRLNREAERECQRGKWLTLRHGVLAAVCAGGDKLRRAITCAAGAALGRGDTPPLLSLSDTEGTERTIVVCPFHSDADATLRLREPAAALFFRGPQNPKRNGVNAYGELHGLTPAERRLLGALVAGTRVGDYADEVGVTMNTAYSQLKAIFAKTGHSRQAELLRDVIDDPMLKLRSIRR